MLNLPLFGSSAKAEPRHDAWPPTWRSPSGAVCVETSFKEPGRQKLVDKATKAIAFLALAFVAIGHQQWPWPDLVALILRLTTDLGPVGMSDRAAAWLFAGVAGVGAIVGIFRLLIAALGVDQGRFSAVFCTDQLKINGSIYDRRIVNGFEMEPHHLGKVESHDEKRLGQSTSLYYRNAFTIVLNYGDRRIEVANMMGKRPTSRLLARLQVLSKDGNAKTTKGSRQASISRSPNSARSNQRAITRPSAVRT